MAVVAECSTNWKDIAEAKAMIQAIKGVGNGVLAKFQLFNAEHDRGLPHYEWVKAHELTFVQARELIEYGASINQEVFFSVFDPKYVDWCEAIGVARYKIAAGEWLNKSRTMEAVFKTNKPVIYSMNPPLMPAYKNRINRLLCPEGYPPLKINLQHLDNYDGLSDHTIGLDVAKIALSRGASIIEKHFCLKHNPDFPDDAWSMDLRDLRELVRFEKVCREVL